MTLDRAPGDVRVNRAARGGPVAHRDPVRDERSLTRRAEERTKAEALKRVRHWSRTYYAAEAELAEARRLRAEAIGDARTAGATLAVIGEYTRRPGSGKPTDRRHVLKMQKPEPKRGTP